VFYQDGFSGKDDSLQRRIRLARELGLPARISANALIEVLNTAFTYEEYRTAADKINKKC
jgi:ribonuclease M5